MIELLAKLRLVDDMSSKLKRITGGLGSFSGKVIGASAAIAGLGAGLTAAAVAANSLGKAMDFEAQMSSIAALTGATNKEMAQMQALALKMGANTKYNALEAAQGIEELLKAGLSPATVQAGGLEAALNLATAGGLDLASAAEIMSTALNAFQEDGMTAAQAADILAGTANASATSVEELRYSLSMTSAVAAGLGMNFEDTNVALGLFANRGLKGSDAGTSLKTMLQTLQPVTDEQIELFRALGLVTEDGSNQFFDAAGNIKSLNEIAGTLRKSMAKLTNQERQHALKLMFGTDAVRAATILFKEGAEGVDKFRDEMSKVTALDVARKKMDNASGAVEQFRGALETLQISGMTPLLPIIKDMANAAADFIEKYSPQIVAGMQSMVDKAKAYVKKNFIDNPEWQRLTTLEQKIEFTFDKFGELFNNWWNAGGKTKVTAAAEKITSVIASVLGNSQPLINAAIKLGVGIADGVRKGIMDSLKLPEELLNLVPGGNTAQTKRLIEFNQKMSDTDNNTPMFGGEAVMQAPQPKSLWDSVTGVFKGHNGGLDRVPYSGYNATLHAGEAVLTREEAKRWRGDSGANGGGKTAPNIIIHNVNVNNETDYKNFVGALVRDLAL
ncbi:phage tail tape measure protein [Paenibacillus sp. ISL-20]|uniref:phage tail tape measure protein n=1 Tax=Paenibacillus sp. ISL-20 TaxID=2819163 RepID=UPI001BEC758D|nr:phage tail tape measure protein [Paenibacillus sp. ISL-20]MBT2761865.1 phage tail tape measure protein [Paenibacillus sp. ISL-20]